MIPPNSPPELFLLVELFFVVVGFVLDELFLLVEVTELVCLLDETELGYLLDDE